MTDDARRKKNEYYRNWRKNHKNQVKKYIENYWERQADKLRA